MSTLNVFLDGMTGKVFKILPMYESQIKGEKNHLSDYIDSLVIEMTGSCVTFPELRESAHYIAIINILNYLLNNEFDINTCRREVFKSIDLVVTVQHCYSGDRNE
jgi:hypothetical protein